MILVDTNVVSATMAPAPNAAVLDWLDRQPTLSLHLSTVTVAEIRYGIAALPDGRRRRGLARRFDALLSEGFAGRILPFDEPSADLYGEIMATRRRAGRPMSVLDGQIAAIAARHRCAIATRNVRDFEGVGLEVVNPFEVA